MISAAGMMPEVKLRSFSDSAGRAKTALHCFAIFSGSFIDRAPAWPSSGRHDALTRLPAINIGRGLE